MAELPSRQSPPFVGRRAELRRLFAGLGQVQQSRGLLVLVSGEAGVGKTSLISEFLVQARAYLPAVLPLITRCSFQTSSGDAYGPFRHIIDELLSQETTEVESQGGQTPAKLRQFAAKMARALYELAPDLVGTMVPLGGVTLRAAQILLREGGQPKESKDAAASTGDVPEQIRIFDQYKALLGAAAAEHQLILVIEDLHWADGPSLNLLSFLARHLDQLPIMLIGTYRPSEILKHRDHRAHPVLKIERETIRYGLALKIEVNWLERNSIADYIQRLYLPNDFPEDFADWIVDRTQGNALFMAEILRQMADRGDLVFADGRWLLVARVAGTDDLPESIEAVIEERISQLEGHLIDQITCASVEGDEFTAQVIAAVRRLEEEQVIHDLVHDLDRRHFLVRERGERSIGHGQILSQFHFRHHLFREYLYRQHLSQAQRRLLHHHVGEALERLYGDQCRLIAVQLAYHFKAAHEAERAVPYLLLAADSSQNVRAIPEAYRYFREAGEILGVKLAGQLRSSVDALDANGSDAVSLAQNFCLYYAAYMCANGPQQRTPLDQLITPSMARRFVESGPEAMELYQLVLRLLMFLSETAISRQDASLYPDIVAINQLVTDYLSARDEHLAAAFRYSYLAWVAECLGMPHNEIALQAARTFVRMANKASLEGQLQQAFAAMEAAAFNFWHSQQFLAAARIYAHMCDLLPLFPEKRNGLITYGWLGARNYAWAAERQLQDPALREQAAIRGADLFVRVSGELTYGGAFSLGAARMYRKALELLPERNAAQRAAIAAKLRAVEQHNQEVLARPMRRRAAVIAEAYDPEASAENVLGDRLVSNLIEHGIWCDHVLPESIEAMRRLPERYDLIVMQSGPRSPRPQGQYVLEIFSDVKDFERLYLSRQHYLGIWEKRYLGATWVLVAGNGVLLTTDAAEEFVRQGKVQELLSAAPHGGMP